MENAEKLAHSKQSCLTAPAGCGKTHLISEAVARHGGRHELILTHTHAGVDALRKRLSSMGVKGVGASVQTIAGWALGYALAFPKSSGITYTLPANNAEWTAVYDAVTQLLSLSPFKNIIAASYSGGFIDEYQDCTVSQHRLILALGKIIPIRILGDPLQGIFDFGSNDPVNWNRDVLANFTALSIVTTPHRWDGKNPQLGTWLSGIRAFLERGEPVDLHGAPVKWIRLDRQIDLPQVVSLCLGTARDTRETVVAIHHMPAQCHFIASRLKGVFSCIEPIDCEDLYRFARELHAAVGALRPIAAIDFVTKCMTGIGPLLKNVRAAYARGGAPSARKPEVLRFLQRLTEIAQTTDVRPVRDFLKESDEISGFVMFRPELFQEACRMLDEYHPDLHENLVEAAVDVRNRTRQRGRHLGKCTVGRTVLIKGLEFDHAIVLDGDALRAKDLYVAMTRGSRSLTVCSRDQVLRPRP